MIRFLPRFTILILCVLSYAQPAQADGYTVSEPTDFWFEFDGPTMLSVRTYSNSDPHLWLYREDGSLVAANDDYFGLDSYLLVPVDAGRYRLRAGVCCGDPDRWYGGSFQLETDRTPVAPTSTTTSTTTSTLPETTTTEVATTWVPSTTSTTPDTTTTTTAPTTTAPATTTTSTTTLPPTSSTSTSEPDPTDAPAPSVPVTVPPAPPSTTPATAPTVPPVTSTQPPTPSSTFAPEPTTPPTTVPASDPTSPSDPSILPSDSLQPAVVTEPPADAPEDVKRAFEAEVNIFSGDYDDYIPAGSTVTVAERRTLTAVSVTMGVMPVGPRRRTL